MVSLISGLEHFTFLYKHTRHNVHKKWKKRRISKHGLGLAPSARRLKSVTLFCSFLCICGLSRVCIQAKFPHSHKERWLILSCWPTWPLGPQVLDPPQAVASLWLLLTALSSWLLSSFYCPWTLPSLIFFRFPWEILRAIPLCGSCAKTDKRILLLVLPYTQKIECHQSCRNTYEWETLRNKLTLLSTQNNTIRRKKNIKAESNNMHESSKCRFCRNKDKMTHHIISECNKLAQKKVWDYTQLGSWPYYQMLYSQTRVCTIKNEA